MCLYKGRMNWRLISQMYSRYDLLIKLYNKRKDGKFLGANDQTIFDLQKNQTNCS